MCYFILILKFVSYILARIVEDLKYKTKNYTYYYHQYGTRRSFADNIYTGKINTDEAEMDQSNLLQNKVEFYLDHEL